MQHHRVDPQLKMTSHVDNVVRWTGLRGEVFQIAAIKENIFKVSMYPRGDPPLDRTWIASNNLEMDLDGYPRENFDRFQPLPKMHLEEGDGHLLLSSGKVQVKVNDGTCRLSWSYENACFACDSVLGSYAYEVDGPSFHQMERLKEENYYGLGEVSGTLNRGGRRFRMTCKDAMGYDAQTTDPLYKHFPMITTLNTKHHIASAVLYDNFGDGTIDLGKEISAFRGSYRYYQADSGFIDYYFIIGPSMAQVSDLAGSLVGRPAVPPRWALGYVASTMTYADSDNAQERLEEFPSLCKKFEMPCTGFYLSSGYTMDTHGNRNVFTWNRERIPSPENMLNAFTSSGIHVIANIKPWLLEHHPKFQSMSQLLVHTTSASWFWKGGPGTFAKGLYLDFTNPETCTWWEAQIEEQLVAKGVTAIWNDNNEFEIDDSSAPCHFKHMPIGLLGRPLLQLLMARSSFHALKKYSQRPLVVTRSACLGTFRFAAQTWSGDNTTSFHTMKWNIPMSLGLGLVGFVGNGADIGGFTGEKVSQELFLRWIQMGIYMPRFSIHSSSWKGNNEDKYNLSGTNEPWMFPEIENNVRELLKLRYRLVPLLLSLHLEASINSYPVMRPLVFHYANDKNDQSREESFSWMLGRDLLVAPVLEEHHTNKVVYFPGDDEWWCDLHDGTWYQGGTSASVVAPLKARSFGCPLFLRNNSGLILEAEDGKLELLIASREKNATFDVTWYQDSTLGPEKVGIPIQCSENSIVATTSSLKVATMDSRDVVCVSVLSNPS